MVLINLLKRLQKNLTNTCLLITVNFNNYAGLPQSQEKQEKHKRQEKIRFKKSLGGVRKLNINLFLIRKFIIPKNCILLILFYKKFCFCNLYFLELN